MKYLYHLTKPEYLDRILSEGLKPIVGDNSKLVGDMVLSLIILLMIILSSLVYVCIYNIHKCDFVLKVS